MGLLVQSWFVQRRYASNARRLWLSSLALCLPWLAAMWLGLNVIRFYTYNGAIEHVGTQMNVYGAVIRIQYGLQWCALVLAVVVGIWAILEFAHFVAMRVSAR